VAQADPDRVRAVRDAEAKAAADAAAVRAAPSGARPRDAALVLPTVPSARVGVWGGWDLDDLSQALVGRVVSAELARRLPGALLRFAAPYGGARGLRTGLGEPVEELGPFGEARRSRVADGLDAVVVVGDLTTDPEVAAGRYARLPREDEPALHLVRGPHGVPVHWGPVRVDGGPTGCVPPGQSLEQGLQPLPDPGVLAPRVLPPSEVRRRRRYLQAAGWLAVSDRVVAVHLAADTDLAPVLALLTELTDADSGLSVVALELDTSRGDGAAANAVTTALPQRALLCPVDAGVDAAVAAVAGADLVVSTSPTTLAVAAAYGVPAVGLDRLADAPDLLAADRDEPRAVSAQTRDDQAALDRWFDAVAEAVRGAVAPAEERAVLSATERYAALERAHAVMRARTSSEVLLASESLPRLEVTDRGEVEHLRAELAALRSTRSFRALEKPRAAYARLRRLVR
jgi:hypothetical protein